MSEPHIKIADALGAAQSYLHSMRLMAETIFNGEGKDFCAFDLLIDSISIEIENAFGAFDEMSRRVSEANDNCSQFPLSGEERILDEIEALKKRLGCSDDLSFCDSQGTSNQIQH